VKLTVVAPVRDEGPSLRGHVLACIRAISGLDVEVILIDNMSIDGCCRGLPRDVLVVRTEETQSPAQLWRLGCVLSQSDTVVWISRLLGYRPAQLRSLLMAAMDSSAQEATHPLATRSPAFRFTAARTGAALLTPQARASLDRLRRTPLVGPSLFALGASYLRLLKPLALLPNDSGNCMPPSAQNQELDPANGATSGQTPAPVSRGRIPLSVIITSHNEGAEVTRTVQSVRANTRVEHEIIVVDDGSSDGSCSELESLGIRIIRQEERVGVAYARRVGSDAAVGDALAYLDAHQRVEPGSLDRCAELALAYEAIACPPCRPLNKRYPVTYGASFRLCAERKFFATCYRPRRPRREVTRISGLRSPAYVIPRSLYSRVTWITLLRGWGATDLCVGVKAFFTDVTILHIHTGATQHLFRTQFPYETNWEGIWRNHALIARVCFDDATWKRHWLPEVFRSNLSDDVLNELDSPAVLAEREAFMAIKVRPDREFWRGLLRIPEPTALR
jgi:glycosyltransferase involved in cell wall biosynthesis